jgi:hypothetical protein
LAAQVQQINVPSKDDLENTVSSYIAQGFVVSNRTTDSVTLFKKKEFNVLWAVIGFFLCLLPLIVYCIVYATQSDQMIVIRVGAVTGPAQVGSGDLTWSEDRQWWWDGTNWRDAAAELPPGAQLSDDQDSWWDGSSWRPVPTRAQAAQPAPPPPPEPEPGSEDPSDI